MAQIEKPFKLWWVSYYRYEHLTDVWHSHTQVCLYSVGLFFSFMEIIRAIQQEIRNWSWTRDQPDKTGNRSRDKKGDMMERHIWFQPSWLVSCSFVWKKSIRLSENAQTPKLHEHVQTEQWLQQASWAEAGRTSATPFITKSTTAGCAILRHGQNVHRKTRR